MLRSLSLLFAAAFLLTGCRETITGPDPIGPPPPPSSPTEASTPLYIKGPETLQVTELGNFRAEPLSDPRLDHYRWTYYGNGDLVATPTDPAGQSRLIRAEATGEGALFLLVRAYDAEGNRIASGSKEVVITPF